MQIQSKRRSGQSTVSSTVQPSGVGEIREIGDSVVRVDTLAPLAGPHAPAEFHRYVDWLASNKKDVSPSSVPSTGPESRQADAREKTVPDASGYALAQETLADTRFEEHYIRVDAAHATLKPASRTRLLERQTQSTSDEANNETVGTKLLPGFPVAQGKPLAQWEVNDFRWPVSVERLIYQQPKLAMLLLNQCTRYIRPNANRLVVCGNGRQQGASTIAMGLARWGAENGRRVLLVDADMSNPTLLFHLGLEPSLDISWVKGRMGSLPIAESMVESNRTRVCLMPLKLTPGKVGSRAALDELGALVDEIALQFDLIVIDTGSANQLMNSLSRADRLADSLVLVHNRKTAAPDLYLQTAQRLKHFGIQNLVVAENFSESGS